jgi:hypothetical protein
MGSVDLRAHRGDHRHRGGAGALGGAWVSSGVWDRGRAAFVAWVERSITHGPHGG